MDDTLTSALVQPRWMVDLQASFAVAGGKKALDCIASIFNYIFFQRTTTIQRPRVFGGDFKFGDFGRAKKWPIKRGIIRMSGVHRSLQTQTVFIVVYTTVKKLLYTHSVKKKGDDCVLLSICWTGEFGIVQ